MTLTQWVGVGILVLSAIGWLCAGVSLLSWLEGDIE